MEWKWPGGKYIHTPDMRFYIVKSKLGELWVYTLADGQQLVCSERGEGALERCKAIAEERSRA